ncbi:TolC family protein [Epibacterium sp. DP7N7-1]|jgi:adhesin transport system outer membrane protein|uniref:Transporter n=1 Tax=Tritonibacter mobilis F1926 TaxID=1265309 RepID=A0A1B1A3V1_9RHOB|nr:TolC family protein [Tritonibacter mobilis]EEW58853.1 outer membrane efflux protein [Ruegeria sp. TrichCH4B]MBW3241297.1 TolC family protein [Epibacterium sp. DP7N7-1]MCZ4267114.1 TolC family protein [Rhodobacteraceae bacterium G21628-S1]MEE2809814.1 TolC family protein [Pseudomonadota bacterium]NKX38192.1 TolC family protein [Rhodobacteraceae bacterium R_SAG5]NKX73259.1 TolC family protein [Rhodobacteraceae bacterium R_SAG3]PXW84130.1 adhesin transport system outer membrane protein [Rueg
MALARRISAVALLCSLTACGLPLPGTTSGTQDGTAARSNFAQAEDAPQSEVITALMQRQSLLENGSTYDTVATAALSASARASEAALISAKLRAEAKSKNWLPSLRPSVSLNDLGEMVASMLLEQVLFDNGRRKAERAFAAADVEVAAVTLSADMNDRVKSALSLYVSGLRGDEKAAYAHRAIRTMRDFERVVVGRVNGGVSDRSDLNVVQSKISGMQSSMATANDAARTARAELEAMTGQSFSASPQRLNMSLPPDGRNYLSVLKAQSEATRTIEQAKMERAGLLPQVSATGQVGSEGSGAGVLLNLAEPLGFGTPAALRAVEASKEAALRRIGEAEEEARREYSREMQRLASYRRQEREALALSKASRETYNLFKAQFEAGQRPVMDVIPIYEELVKREQAYIDAKYEVVMIQLALAASLGLLADGDKI